MLKNLGLFIFTYSLLLWLKKRQSRRKEENLAILNERRATVEWCFFNHNPQGWDDVRF